jgi:GTPase KRas protein
MRDQWMRAGQVFVVVFSLTSLTTFDDLESYYIEQILRVKDVEYAPMILVG